MGVGLMRSLQPPDILWIHWRVYNFIVNTSKQVLFLPPSDAYVRSFLYLLYTLIKLYYTHTHKSLRCVGLGSDNKKFHACDGSTQQKLSCSYNSPGIC